jgi:hypothetical protein
MARWKEGDNGGTGTVSTISVASANGFGGSVATPTTTPVISITTSIIGLLLGDGTGVSAAPETGTGDYVRANAPTLVSPVVNTGISGTAIQDDSTFASPSSTKVPTSAAVKAYVDNLLAGLSWKAAVRVATTANGTLATAFANGQTIDGVVLATGDRILIKNQSTATVNGIYIVQAAGAPVRSTDNDTGVEMLNATCLVEEGTTNAETQWTCSTNAPITIGVTNITFVAVNVGTYSAGTGLTLTGNQFAIDTSVVARKSDNLSVFAATTSAQLASIMSDETGTGALVFATNPSLVKPTMVGTVQVTTAMAAQALDGSLGNSFTRTLAASETFTQSNFTAGQYFNVVVKQGSGTSYTVTWFSGITWMTTGGTAPVQTTTTNGYTSYMFKCTGTNTFEGYLAGTQ